MKKGIAFNLFYLLALVVVLVNSFYIFKENFFINIESVPQGEFQYSQASPDNDFKLDVYLIKTSVGNSVRVVEVRQDSSRNIFWQTGIEDVKIKWKNNTYVIINGIDLDLKKGEYFDCRSITSIFNDGLMGR